MNILHVIHRYPPAIGGSEVWCRELSVELTSRGHRVEVATLDALAEDDFAKAPVAGARCRDEHDGAIRVGRYRRRLPGRLIRRILGIVQRRAGIACVEPHSPALYGALPARARAADLVHLHTLPYPHNLAGWLAARLVRRPVVMTPYLHAGHPLYEARSSRWLLRHCDLLVALSEHERAALVERGVPEAKIVVAGAGVRRESYRPGDLEARRRGLAARGLEPASEIVLFLGRKEEPKGIPLLAEAVLEHLGRPGVSVVLAGPDTRWFRAWHGALPADARRRIVDAGTLPEAEKIDLLHLSRVLVLPSKAESFGLVFLEAWACGLPVIGAAAGPVPEILDGAGLTFRPDDAADLARQIGRLLDDRALARRLAERGRDAVRDRHTWPRVAARVERGYRRARGGGLRVLVCSDFFPPNTRGGAEIAAARQVRALANLGHTVRVFAGRMAGSGFPRRGTMGVTWVRLAPGDLHPAALGNDRAHRAFVKLLDTFRPDLVHFHNLQGLSHELAAETARRRLPSLLTLHDYWGLCYKNQMLKNDGAVCRRSGVDCLGCREVLPGTPSLPSPVRNGHVLAALRHVGRFLAPSRYLAERYLEAGLPADRMTIFPLGIDPETFATPVPSAANAAVTFGYVGQLVAHKGVDVLLRALCQLGTGAPVRLVVAGDGPDARGLRELGRELGLGQRLEWLGSVPSQLIGRVYARLDAVVVPSVWPENHPQVIVEAMAGSLPIVASDVGGIGELVDEGTTGYLVPPGDAGALAEGLERLALDAGLRRRLGRQGREKIGRFTLAAQMERLVAIYEELLDESAPPRADPEALPEVLLYADDVAWSPRLRELLAEVAALEPRLGRRSLVCRADLVDERTAEEARLLIVTTSSPAALPRALDALRRRVPLLVSASNSELAGLCRVAQAGLEYADAAELRACLRRLLGDERLRRRLGEQGRRFVEGFRRAGS